MSWTGSHLAKMIPFLNAAPSDAYFDARVGQLQFQARDMTGVEALRSAFRPLRPDLVWKREWRKENNWWEFTAQVDNWSILIYGVYYGPDRCVPIKEKKVVIKKVPVSFKEVAVEEEVIVGWDCGPNEEVGR